MSSLAGERTTTPHRPGVVFRPYCDQCGERFEDGQLRPLSKFCSYCGEPLSDWVKRRLAPDFAATSVPLTPPITPANHPEVNDKQRGNAADETFAGELLRGRVRGRGRGVRSSRGAGRGRGIESLTPSMNEDEGEFGRGLRVSSRPDYSVQRYYRDVLRGTLGTNIANVATSLSWSLIAVWS